MLITLRNPTFRHLFAAQIVALLGTGLATVALGLLAWQLAGDNAGAVLGTALAIKMIAYVTLAPVAAAVAERLPRRAFLVALDLIRAGVIAVLPFVDQVWQIYVLIFFLQAASAGFTPAFQAVIPDVLKDEDDYTNALSLLRLAEDLEQLASPIIAALLLTVVSFPVLFVGTVVGFVASALLVVTARLPDRVRQENSHFWADVTKGIRIYTRTPRLRGLMVMEAAVAAAGAMVYVNTVVLVQARLGLGEEAVALAFAGFGAGSMLAAFLLPRILDRLADRPVMIGGAALMVAGVALVPLVGGLASLITLWALIGFGFFPDPDAHRPHHQPLGPRGRPGRGLRRAVRAEPRVLARDLSARRVGGRRRGAFCCSTGLGRDRCAWIDRRAAHLACGRHRDFAP